MSIKDLVKNEYERTLRESPVLRFAREKYDKRSEYKEHLAEMLKNSVATAGSFAKKHIDNSVVYVKRLPGKLDDYLQQQNEKNNLEKKLVIGTCIGFVLLSSVTAGYVNHKRILKSTIKGISYATEEATKPLKNWSKDGSYLKPGAKIEDLKDIAKENQKSTTEYNSSTEYHQ